MEYLGMAAKDRKFLKSFEWLVLAGKGQACNKLRFLEMARNNWI